MFNYEVDKNLTVQETPIFVIWHRNGMTYTLIIICSFVPRTIKYNLAQFGLPFVLCPEHTVTSLLSLCDMSSVQSKHVGSTANPGILVRPPPIIRKCSGTVNYLRA